MSLTRKSNVLGDQAEAAVSRLRRQRREEQLRADPGWQERVKGIDHQITPLGDIVSSLRVEDAAEQSCRSPKHLGDPALYRCQR